MDPQDTSKQPKDGRHSPKDNDNGAGEAREQEKANATNSANIIRQKLESLYAEEPSAKAKEKEAAVAQPRSKHQQFVHELSQSGKSLADIQTAWHEYYAGLSDADKQAVWDEFYASNQHLAVFAQTQRQPEQPAQPEQPRQHIPHPAEPKHTKHHPRHKPSEHPQRSASDVKHQLLQRPRSVRKHRVKQHFQSLMFGLGMGALVVLLLLFSFFNERFIAPFIMPSRHVSSTPIIIDPSSSNVGNKSEVIIPKINVETPVVYDVSSIADQDVQKGLERGVLHYPITPNPGQNGNVVIFGHSSSNILNHGQAKFAFVLLGWLNNGDLFYLTRGGKRYVYRVYKKEIVQPTDVSVIGEVDRPNTATLITCDPPGTSVHRLVVVGEQISPDPVGNTASTALKSNQQPTIIPSNSTTLWQRVKDWFGG